MENRKMQPYDDGEKAKRDTTASMISRTNASSWFELSDDTEGGEVKILSNQELIELSKVDIDIFEKLDSQYKIVYNDINDRLSLELGVSHSALSQMYPPNGFIAWHTNENAIGANLIFTWSETGDGYFEYLDKEGKKVRMQDKVGWSCKAGYFGERDDDKHVYHCARTNCKRITLSYLMTDACTDWWEDCVEHIERG